MNDQAARQEPETPAETGRPDENRGRRIFSAHDLFADRTEIEIAFGDAVYRLRQTRAGKLILTK